MKKIKRLLNKIIYYIKREPIESGRIYLYTDKNGNDWYELDNIFNLSISRKLLVDECQCFIDMSITKERLSETLAKAIEYFNEGKNAQASNLLVELQIRLDVLHCKEAFVSMCAAIFLFEDENPMVVNDAIIKKKKEIFNNDPELCDFFLQRFLARQGGLETELQQGILQYFKQIAPTAKFLNRPL